jgi:hypothetical protein
MIITIKRNYFILIKDKMTKRQNNKAAKQQSSKAQSNKATKIS